MEIKCGTYMDQFDTLGKLLMLHLIVVQVTSTSKLIQSKVFVSSEIISHYLY
jgi:hypothetical protein